MHQIQPGTAVQLRTIKSAPIAMDAESVQPCRSVDTRQSASRSAVFDWAFLVMELFKSGEELHAKKFVYLPYYDNFDMENATAMLNNVTSCSELLRKCSRRMITKEGFIMEKERIEEGGHVHDSAM